MVIQDFLVFFALYKSQLHHNRNAHAAGSSAGPRT